MVNECEVRKYSQRTIKGFNKNLMYFSKFLA